MASLHIIEEKIWLYNVEFPSTEIKQANYFQLNATSCISEVTSAFVSA
jgi:hypothetical protein